MSTAVSICSAERLLLVRLCKLSFGFRSSNTLCRHPNMCLHLTGLQNQQDRHSLHYCCSATCDLQNGRLLTRAVAPSQGRAIALATMYVSAGTSGQSQFKAGCLTTASRAKGASADIKLVLTCGLAHLRYSTVARWPPCRLAKYRSSASRPDTMFRHRVSSSSPNPCKGPQSACPVPHLSCTQSVAYCPTTVAASSQDALRSMFSAAVGKAALQQCVI